MLINIFNEYMIMTSPHVTLPLLPSQYVHSLYKLHTLYLIIIIMYNVCNNIEQLTRKTGG